MIPLEDLRKGNLVNAIWVQMPDVGCSCLKINSFNEGGVESIVSVPQTAFYGGVYAKFDDLEPIKITKFWLNALRATYDYPKHIQYVHQLQNWHYANHNKEISLDKLVFEEDALNLNPEILRNQIIEYEALLRHPKLF